MKRPIAILGLVFLLVGLAVAVSALPNGATVSVGKPQTRNTTTPGNVTAQGGNITEVNITSDSQTQAWQGFWGQVDGSLVLEDASGIFYRWSLFNISGEIYASRNSTVNFANINPNNNCSNDNSLTGFNMADSVNNTYVNNSNRFIQVGTVAINTSTACAVYTFVNSTAQSNFFQDIILTDAANNLTNFSVGGNSTIYATPIEGNLSGYNTRLNKYQLLVPVNKASGFSTYFFYAELG